ncbi:MAG: 2-oxoacid:acceptor oxidoreductase subunit alpha [Eubacteriales bacterium]|nr:2-oxoacid:acceptor oxidoreductase subunit alpha [Eubacteriales bacterium]
MENKPRLIQGNRAVAEGAIAAGVNFFAGYPITPSTEIAEILAELLPKNGGKFIQMEDEIAGMAATIGASLTGKKAFTASSGPGISLKQENVGYAQITETPCVIVNVQRLGPSTGGPTLPSQGDIMQARWGSHGDGPIITLCPISVPECFSMTITAVNLSEKFRTPVYLMLDEVVGHMRERIVIPNKEDIEIVDRKRTDKKPGEYKPYAVEEGSKVPDFADFGQGYKWHVTGLIHDETGFPSNSTKEVKKLLDRLMTKFDDHLDEIIMYEELEIEDAETVIVAYGSVARSAISAVKRLREAGEKVGVFIPKTIWPFPEQRLREIAQGPCKRIISAEMNYGQLSLEIERIVVKYVDFDTALKSNGLIITPEELMDKVRGGNIL